MKRFNMYCQTYKGMTILLYDAATQFARTDFWGLTALNEATKKVNEIIHLLKSIAQTEESYIWPVIESTQPLAVEDCRYQDKRNMTLLFEVRDALLFLQQNGNTEAANGMKRTFTTFMAFAIGCLEKKEALVRNQMQDVYKEIEIVYIWLQLLYTVTVKEATGFCRCTLRGLDEDNIIFCLKTAAQIASGDLYHSLLKITEGLLSTERWGRVRNAIAEGALLA